MKTGVSMTPCAVVSLPRRAGPSRRRSSNSVLSPQSSVLLNFHRLDPHARRQVQHKARRRHRLVHLDVRELVLRHVAIRLGVFEARRQERLLVDADADVLHALRDPLALRLEVEHVERLVGAVVEREVEERGEVVEGAAGTHVFEDAVLIPLDLDPLGFVQIGVVRRQTAVRDQHLHAARRVGRPVHAVRLLVDEAAGRDLRLRQKRERLLLPEVGFNRDRLLLLRLNALHHFVERGGINGGVDGNDCGGRDERRDDELPCGHGEPNAAPETRISGRESYTQRKSRSFMKKTLLVVGVVLMVRTATAGVEYESRQTMHSDVEAVPSSDFGGRAVIDGDRSRVDFLSGTAFPPGTYVILSDGARTQTWVDPSKKSYVQIKSGSAGPGPRARHHTTT